MKRLMSIVALVFALPGFASADDPTVVYFTRPEPIEDNSHVYGQFGVGLFRYDEDMTMDGDSLELDEEGVDSVSVTGQGTASISTGAVTSSFYAAVSTSAPQGASTISGSLSAESTLEANISDPENNTEWSGNGAFAGELNALAEFDDSFTIDGEVSGTPVTVFYTVTIFAQVDVGINPGPALITLHTQLEGPGLAGNIAPGGTIEYTDENGVFTVVDVDELITEDNGVGTISATFNARHDSYVVGDSFSVSVNAFADTYGGGTNLGIASASASGTATVGWSATVVAQP